MSSNEMMSLFSDFEEFASLVPEAPKAEVEAPKAEKKPAAKKSKAKAKAGKKREPGKFKLPITVQGPNFTKEIEGEGEVDETELAKRLFESGIKQAGADYSVIVPVSDGKAIMAVTGLGADDEDVVDITVPLYVCRGECVMELSTEMFEGREQGEVCIADIKVKWAESYPDFSGCGMLYDPASNIAYPLASGFKYGKKTKKGYRQADADIADELIVSAEGDEELDIKAAGTGLLELDNLPTGVTVEAKEISENDDGIKVILDFKSNAGTLEKPFAKSASEAGVESGKKVEQMVKLPIIIKYPMYDDEELTPEMFGGQEKVSLNDIEAYAIKAHPSAYSTSSADFSYKSDWKYVVAGVKSAKKG